MNKSKYRFCVYRIKNKINGNFYIGSSSNVKKRWETHRRNISSYQPGKNINNSFDLPFLMKMDIEGGKFTLEDFDFKILRYFETKKEMLQCEQKLLDRFWNTKHCYNNDFEVIDSSVHDFLVAWNMESLSYFIYRTREAAENDLHLPRGTALNILEGKINHWNGWVVEDYYKIWNQKELKSFFRKNKFTYSQKIIDKEGNFFKFLSEKPIYIGKWNRPENTKIFMRACNYVNDFFATRKATLREKELQHMAEMAILRKETLRRGSHQKWQKLMGRLCTVLSYPISRFTTVLGEAASKKTSM